jgi:phospholipid/cholesterol/gamma-HCH transport system substrate-binding protein
MKFSIENKARLAFAIAILVGAGLGAAWWLADASRYATYQIDTRDSVSGLIADAPVEFHGVEMGRVTRVELTGPQSVRVLLSIRKDAPVTQATVATITSRGLATRGFTGYVYVSLDNMGTDSGALVAAVGQPFPVIPSAPSRSVSLDTAISQVNENVQVLSDLLQSVLDRKTIASLKQSVDGLQQITHTLAANNAKLSTILSNTERASSQFKPLLDSSHDTVKALQTQILPDAYKTLANLDRLTSTLNGAATKISRDPSVLLRGSAALPPGPGETK